MGYAITSPAEKPRRRTSSSFQKTASGDFFALTKKTSLENLCNPLKTRQGNTATPTKTASGVHFKNYLDHVYAVSDDNGNIQEHYRYTAFGEPEIYSPSGVKLASSAIDNTMLWNSRRYDFDTNLYYYKYRHYKSDIGRWLGRDPIEEESDALNLYEFVYNQPLKYWDKHGLKFTLTKVPNVLFTQIQRAGLLNFARTDWQPNATGNDNIPTFKKNGLCCAKVEKAKTMNLDVKLLMPTDLKFAATKIGIRAIKAHEKRRITALEYGYNSYLKKANTTLFGGLPKRCGTICDPKAGVAKAKLQKYLVALRKAAIKQFDAYNDPQQLAIGRENLIGNINFHQQFEINTHLPNGYLMDGFKNTHKVQKTTNPFVPPPCP